jgi:pyrimidine operon attenuation protein/uracil phosphoribosyltransferase
MPEPRPSTEVVVLTAEQMSRTITRIAHEIFEKNPGEGNLAVVGIHTRGAFLGARIHRLLCEVGDKQYAAGNLDISFYRDDVAARGAVGVVPSTPQPVVKDTDLPFAIDGARIVLVDDVLYTGRTIRAALDAIMDFGRPRQIELCVLVDRGNRELPIQADYVGIRVETDKRTDSVAVILSEVDRGPDRVVLFSRPA